MKLAKITWARTPPPIGARYVAPVRFEDDHRWPEEAWSLVVECEPGGDSALCRIAFLARERPTTF
jgi:hypothetical protein